MGFDFDALRTLIRDELRPVVQEAVENESESGLYAFFIRTAESGAILTATCNTEESLEEAYGDEPPEPDDDLCFPEYCNMRWNDAEWTNEIIDYNDGTLRLDAQKDRFYEEFPSEDHHFGGAAHAAMILALRDLDREGLFGSGDERESLTLYCGPSDGDPAWLFVESAQRLNSASNASRFAEEWQLATGTEPDPPAGPLYETFVTWIDRQAD